ncbi:MAG: hypothetical protein P1U61_08370 [Legionellaceae bacterium]|nr:hypothetical protein [Legionellaceae bacterium]
MPLNRPTEKQIQLFRTCCLTGDFAGARSSYHFLQQHFGKSITLHFQIIPDVLAALSQQTTARSQEIAQWLIAPERFDANTNHLRIESIPHGLLLKSIPNPALLERLLTWDITRDLFQPTQRALIKTFLHAIQNNEEAIAILLLNQFPTLSTISMNTNLSVLSFALSVPTINQAIIEALITAGANPNGDLSPDTPDITFETDIKLEHRPLHQTIITGNVSAFRALLNAPGINLTQLDGFKMVLKEAPAMQLSLSSIYPRIPQMTTRELSPVRLAKKHDQQDILALLATRGIHFETSHGNEQTTSRKRKRQEFFSEGVTTDENNPSKHRCISSDDGKEETETSTSRGNDDTSYRSSISKMR